MVIGGIDADLVQVIATRIAGLEDERAELKRDIGAELAAAKDKGIDAAVLRTAIANKRKRDADPEKYDRKETTKAQYELALGMPSYTGIHDENPSRVRTRAEASPTAVASPAA